MTSRTIHGFLQNSFVKYPNKKALIFENNCYTYSQLNNKASYFEVYCLERTKKGDIVGLLLPNSPEFVFAYFGILQAACTVLLIPTNISDENLKYQIEKTKPKFIYTTGQYRNKLKRIGCENLSVDPHVIPVTSALKHRRAGLNDISTIIFTSGTTSKPKGVVLRHKNVVQATENINAYLKFSKNDVDVNMSSLSHSFGLGHMHCVISKGGTVVLFRNSIDLKSIIKALKEHKASTFSAVPTILRLMFENYAKDIALNGKKIRFLQTNTSSLDTDLIKIIRKTLPNSKFHYYYGLSEASRSTFMTFTDNESKYSSIGRPAPNVQIRIVDVSGKKVKTGRAGEICIKGGHVITEYWKNKKASQRIKNGWLYTKDVGYFDDDGYLYYVGRVDDVINVAGEKVSPEEVEEAAKKIYGIKDAAAVAIPDRLLGQAVKLYIVPEGGEIDKEFIKAELRKSVEAYKVPKVVETISFIPKTDNGKIRRQLLKNDG